MNSTLTLGLFVLLFTVGLHTSSQGSHHETSPEAVRHDLVPASSDAAVTPEILHEDDHVKIALVTIAPGATMPEHATPVPVTVQTISGRGSMSVSGQPHELVVGSIYTMDANAPHALSTTGDEPLVVLVHYLKGAATAAHDH